jgi:hypothetical protein
VETEESEMLGNKLHTLGAVIGGVGLAYSIYANEQAKKAQKEMARQQQQEAARQATNADIQAAGQARQAGAAVAGSTGGKSGGSTILGAMLGIEGTAAADSRNLAEATSAQIGQIGLQAAYNNQALDTNLVASIVKTSGEMFRDWRQANPPGGTNPPTQSTVPPYQPPAATSLPAIDYSTYTYQEGDW